MAATYEQLSDLYDHLTGQSVRHVSGPTPQPLPIAPTLIQGDSSGVESMPNPPYVQAVAQQPDLSAQSQKFSDLYDRLTGGSPRGASQPSTPVNPVISTPGLSPDMATGLMQIAQAVQSPPVAANAALAAPPPPLTMRPIIPPPLTPAPVTPAAPPPVFPQRATAITPPAADAPQPDKLLYKIRLQQARDAFGPAGAKASDADILKAHNLEAANEQQRMWAAALGQLRSQGVQNITTAMVMDRIRHMNLGELAGDAMAAQSRAQMFPTLYQQPVDNAAIEQAKAADASDWANMPAIPGLGPLSPSVGTLESYANAVQFGLPEGADRLLGNGDYAAMLDAQRQEHPGKTLAADLLGFVSPGGAAELAGKGIGAVARPVGRLASRAAEGLIGRTLAEEGGGPLSDVARRVGQKALDNLPLLERGAAGAVEMPLYNAGATAVGSGGDVKKGWEQLNPAGPAFWHSMLAGGVFGVGTAALGKLFQTPIENRQFLKNASPEDQASYARAVKTWDLMQHGRTLSEAITESGARPEDLATAWRARQGFRKFVPSEVKEPGPSESTPPPESAASQAQQPTREAPGRDVTPEPIPEPSPAAPTPQNAPETAMAGIVPPSSDVAAKVDRVLAAARTTNRGLQPVAENLFTMPESGATAVKDQTGIDVSGQPVRLDEDLVRKNDKAVKNPKIAKDLGFEPVADADYQKLEQIHTQPDAVTTGENRGGAATVEFWKRFNGYYYVADAVRTGKGYLNVARFVRIPSDSELVPRPLRANPPGEPGGRAAQTSETSAGTTSSEVQYTPPNGPRPTTAGPKPQPGNKYAQSDPVYFKQKETLKAATLAPKAIVHGTIAQDLGSIARDGLTASGLSGRVDAQRLGDDGKVGTAGAYAGKGGKGDPVLIVLKPGVEVEPSDGGAGAVAVNSPGASHVRPEDIAGVIFGDGTRVKGIDAALKHWNASQGPTKETGNEQTIEGETGGQEPRSGSIETAAGGGGVASGQRPADHGPGGGPAENALSGGGAGVAQKARPADIGAPAGPGQQGAVGAAGGTGERGPASPETAGTGGLRPDQRGEGATGRTEPVPGRPAAEQGEIGEAGRRTQGLRDVAGGASAGGSVGDLTQRAVLAEKSAQPTTHDLVRTAMSIKEGSNYRLADADWSIKPEDSGHVLEFTHHVSGSPMGTIHLRPDGSTNIVAQRPKFQGHLKAALDELRNDAYLRNLKQIAEGDAQHTESGRRLAAAIAARNPKLRLDSTLSRLLENYEPAAPPDESAPTIASTSQTPEARAADNKLIEDARGKDPAAAARLVDHLNEGKGILRSGMSNGRKLNKDELAAMEKSLENTRRKLARIAMAARQRVRLELADARDAGKLKLTDDQIDATMAAADAHAKAVERIGGQPVEDWYKKLSVTTDAPMGESLHQEPTADQQAQIERGQKAVRLILKSHFGTPDAMTVPELGSVSFAVGRKGVEGLADIRERYGEAGVEKLPRLIAMGTVDENLAGGGKVVRLGGDAALLKPIHRNGKDGWMVEGLRPERGGELDQEGRRRETQRWKEDIQAYVDGNLPTNRVPEIGLPSPLLRKAGIPDRIIEITQTVMDKAGEKHGLAKSDLLNLRDAVLNPIMVFKPLLPGNGIGVLTEVRHEGRNVLASIRVNVTRDRVLVNDISTVHPKETSHVLDWIKRDLLLAADGKKAEAWLENSSPGNWGKQQTTLLPKIIGASEPPVKPDTLRQGPKGAISFVQDGKAVIHALEGADISTVLHELGHLFLDDWRRLALETGDPQTKTDMAALEAWAGVKDGKWDRAAHEKFARGFERWLREGKTVVKSLQRAFERFKEWLSDIYKSIKGSPLDVNLTPKVREVMERMVNPETQYPSLAQATPGELLTSDVSLIKKDLTRRAALAVVKRDGNRTQRAYMWEQADGRWAVLRYLHAPVKPTATDHSVQMEIQRRDINGSLRGARSDAVKTYLEAASQVWSTIHYLPAGMYYDGKTPREWVDNAVRMTDPKNTVMGNREMSDVFGIDLEDEGGSTTPAQAEGVSHEATETGNRPEIQQPGQSIEQGKGSDQSESPGREHRTPQIRPGEVSEAGGGGQIAPLPPIVAALGRETMIQTTGEPVKAHYALVDADSLVPSHNPITFKPNPDYPPDVQERQYDRDKEEQQKVERQVRDFDPAFVLTDNPDPVNGPPMILPNGLVMGGNSRAMTIQRVYAAAERAVRGDDPRVDAARDLKSGTFDTAARLGIDTDAAMKMRSPVLVRMIDTGGQAVPPARMRRLVRDLQKGRTQEMTAGADASGRARVLMDNPQSLQRLDGILGDGDSVREAMSDPKKVVRLRTWLESSGVLTKPELARFTHPETGQLSDDGKKLVERVLLGTILPDPDLLDGVPQVQVNKLTGNLAGLVIGKTRGDGWDLTDDLTEALKAWHRWRASGLSLDEFTRGSGQQLLRRDPILDNPSANTLLRRWAGDSAAVWRQRVNDYAAVVRDFDPKQTYFQKPPTAQETFKDAFGGESPKVEPGGLFPRTHKGKLPETVEGSAVAVAAATDGPSFQNADYADTPAQTEGGKRLLKSIQNDPEGKWIGPRSIVEYLTELAKTRLVVGKTQTTKKNPAHYIKKYHVIRSRVGGWNLNFHEVGHALSALLEDRHGPEWEKIRDGLVALTKLEGSMASADTPEEGMAEYVRRAVVAPQTLPPKIRQRMDNALSKLEPEMLAGIRDAHRAWAAHSARDLTAQLRSYSTDKAPPPPALTQIRNLWDSTLFNLVGTEAEVDRIHGIMFRALHAGDAGLPERVVKGLMFRSISKIGIELAKKFDEMIRDTPADFQTAFQSLVHIPGEVDRTLYGVKKGREGIRIRTTGKAFGDLKPDDVAAMRDAGFKLPDEAATHGGWVYLADKPFSWFIHSVGKNQWDDFEIYGQMKAALHRFEKAEHRYPGFTEGITPEKLKPWLAEQEKAHPTWATQFKGINDWMDQLLLVPVLSGELDAATAIKIKQKWEDYWPLPRQNEGATARKSGTGGEPTAGIHRAFGSDLPFRTLGEAVETRVKMAIGAYYQNRAILGVRNAAAEMAKMEDVPLEIRSIGNQLMLPLKLEAAKVATLSEAEMQSVIAEHINQSTADDMGIDLDDLPADVTIKAADVEIQMPGKPIFRMKRPRAVHIVAPTEGGKRIFYHVTDPLLFDLMAASRNPAKAIAVISKMGTGLIAPWKDALTENYIFGLRNLPRDAFTAIFMSRPGAARTLIPFRQMGVALLNRLMGGDLDIVSDSDTWAKSFDGTTTRAHQSLVERFLAEAAEGLYLPGWGEMSLLDKAAALPPQMMAAVMKPVNLFNFLSGGQWFSRLTEQLTREGAAIEEARRGGSLERGQREYDRTTGNFGVRAGNPNMAAMARMAGFLNPGVQIMYGQYHRFFNADPAVRRRAWMAAIPLMAALGAIGAAVNYLNTDEKDRRKLKERPWQERMGTMAIGGTFRVPFDYGISGAAMSYGWNTAEGWLLKEPISGAAKARELLIRTASLPGPLDMLQPQLKVLLEEKVNYSFFFDRQIEPDWMKETYPLNPELRAYPDTPQAYKDLGKWIGVSPIKAQYAIRSIFSNEFDDMLNTAELLLNQKSRGRIREKADLPYVGRLFVRTPDGWRAQSVQTVSQKEQQYESLSRLMDVLVSDAGGGAASRPSFTPQQQTQYDRLLTQRNELNKVHQAMDGIQKIWRGIKTNEATGKPDWNWIDEMENLMVERAREALGKKPLSPSQN